LTQTPDTRPLPRPARSTIIDLSQARQKVILVALENPLADWEESLAELRLLAESAGAEVSMVVTQKRARPHPVSFVGKGRAQEMKGLAAALDTDLIVVDGELTPVQQRNLENLADTPTIDRPGLILDIFAQRARSNEGKLQVELAQSEYLLPRLTGRGVMLSRLGGGIGTRGPGETKLETDRRRIRQHITQLRRSVNEIKKHRDLQRSARSHSMITTASLVGYTNAGKSTLLNALSGAQVEVADTLFATLDPTIRRVLLPDGMPLLLADTVGFIRNLPHQLIAAFRATLEEVVQADLLIHVMDASHPELRAQRAAVDAVLNELGVSGKPQVLVFNKLDLAQDQGMVEETAAREPHAVAISAQSGQGLDRLRTLLGELVRVRFRPVHLHLPYRRADLLALAHQHGRVIEERYADDGIELLAELPEEIAVRLEGAVRRSEER